MLARFELDPTLPHPIRHAVLAVALVCITLATAAYGYVTHPSNEQPPTVPSSPAFIVDMNVDSAMPAAWVVRTNLIEDGPNTWVVLSVDPETRSAAAFDFAILAYGLPVAGATCGLKALPAYPVDGCVAGALANAKFASEEHGLIFPPQSDSEIFPRDGSIHEVTGSAGAGGITLPFALLPGAAPIAHNGAFLSFALPPVVLNVTTPSGVAVNTSVTFDTEIGTGELRTVTLASGNAPSSIIRDTAVNTLDPSNRFLTSWVWAETDALSGSAGAPATVQSTPVAVSAAANVATESSENHQAFLSGIAWGIAGGAAVGAFQEILTNWPIRRRVRPGVPGT
jgi:hypothetical protein